MTVRSTTAAPSMMGVLALFLLWASMGDGNGVSLVVKAQEESRMLGPPDEMIIFDASTTIEGDEHDEDDEDGDDGEWEEDGNLVMIEAAVPLQMAELTMVPSPPSSTLAPSVSTLMPTVNLDTSSWPSGMPTAKPKRGPEGDQGDLEPEQEFDLLLSLSLSFLFPPTPTTPFPTEPFLTPAPTPLAVPATEEPTPAVVMTEEPTDGPTEMVTAEPTLPPVPGQTPDPTVAPSPLPSPLPTPDPTFNPTPEPTPAETELETPEPTEMEVDTSRPTRDDTCRDSTTARFEVTVDYKARWGCGLMRQADEGVIRWYCNNVLRAKDFCKVTCGLCVKGRLIDNGEGRRKSVCRDKGGRRPLLVLESRPCQWLSRRGEVQKKRLCSRKPRMRRFCPVTCGTCP